jgi:uncharacterized protein (UPF0332 family)
MHRTRFKRVSSNGLQFKVTIPCFTAYGHCFSTRVTEKKSHYALLLAIKELYSKTIEPSLISRFEEGMTLRQEADYGLKFSQAGALDTIDGAEKLLSKAKEILKIK